MPTRTSPRLRLLYIAVLLLLLSGCETGPTSLTTRPPTARPPTPPAPTRIPPPPTATLGPPTVPAVFTPPAVGQMLIGTWGWSDIHLTANRFGGAMAFQCAEGSLKQPLLVDGQGRFDVPGTYLDKPGFRQPTPPAPIPARYQGQVIGSTMVLTLTRFYPEPATITYQLPFVSAEPTYSPPTPCA